MAGSGAEAPWKFRMETPHDPAVRPRIDAQRNGNRILKRSLPPASVAALFPGAETRKPSRPRASEGYRGRSGSASRRLTEPWESGGFGRLWRRG